MNNQHHNLTNTEITLRMLKMRLAGHSYEQIGQQFGVSRQRVHQRIGKHIQVDLTHHFSQLKHEKILAATFSYRNQIRHLYVEDGMGYEKIAELLKLNRQWINLTLLDMKISSRDRRSWAKEQKQCSACKQRFPRTANYFYMDKGIPKSSRCKPCTAVYQREYNRGRVLRNKKSVCTEQSPAHSDGSNSLPGNVSLACRGAS